MKKLIALCMAGAMALSMVGCGEKEASAGTPDTTNSQSSFTEHEDSKPTEAPVQEEWGISDQRVCINEQEEMSHYLISYPSVRGKNMGSGACAPQGDSIFVLVDAESSTDTPHMTSLDELFPGQFEQTISVMETFFGYGTENFEFNLSHQEHVEINGYDMLRIEGNVTFTEREKPRNYEWVGYATVMKSNGS